MDLHLRALVLLLATAAGTSTRDFDNSLRFEMDDEDTNIPSCSELRAFWKAFSRSMHISRVTNEIPLMMPSQMMDRVLMQGLASQKGRGGNNRQREGGVASGWSSRHGLEDILLSGKAASKPSAAGFAFQDRPAAMTLLPMDRQHPPVTGSQDPFVGGFGFFDEPEASPPGSAKKAMFVGGGGDEFQWGSPEDVGAFGRFAKDGGDPFPVSAILSPIRIGGSRVETSQSENRKEKAQKANCAALVTSACTSRHQCLCSGWPSMDCVRGKCTMHHAASGPVEDLGYWHAAPIPRGQLGVTSQLRKKRSRSIFM